MKPITSSLISLILFSSAVGAQTRASSRSASDDEAEIRRVEQEYVAAREHNDSTALARMLSPDYVGIASMGRVEGRSYLLARTNVTPNGETIRKMTLDSLEVHMIGPNDAVLVGRRVVTTSDTGTMRFLHVFAKRNGRWQLVAGSVTPIR